MRIILSRKGFDSGAGGCPSPIFSDGSMFAMPIPYARSPVRYSDLEWRGRKIGELVEQLTRGRVPRTSYAHLDPDLRPEMRARDSGWRACLGQHKAAQAHLAKNGVGIGDLFLFWGLFRRFHEDGRWSGERVHVLWGWLQVGDVVQVDAVRERLASPEWRWAESHPHLEFDPDASNTLYVAASSLKLPDGSSSGLPGAGTFDWHAAERQLTAEGSDRPGAWALPMWFLPGERSPLSYHRNAARWTSNGKHALLQAANRGQEFVLDTREYPDAIDWAGRLISSGCRR
jgi:hypothetical protein